MHRRLLLRIGPSHVTPFWSGTYSVVYIEDGYINWWWFRPDVNNFRHLRLYRVALLRCRVATGVVIRLLCWARRRPEFIIIRPSANWETCRMHRRIRRKCFGEGLRRVSFYSWVDLRNVFFERFVTVGFAFILVLKLIVSSIPFLHRSVSSFSHWSAGTFNSPLCGRI